MKSQIIYCLLDNIIDTISLQSFSKSKVEIIFLKKLQRKYFAIEVNQLQNNVKPNSPLDLFLDKYGLIRCRSRLQ